MSRKYNIRWSENDSQALSKAVKNFNAKVSRLEKKYGDDPSIVLPERVSVKQMRVLVTTRRDLQRELKSLQTFTQRGSETIVDVPITDSNIQMTQWQKSEMSKRAAIINRRRNARRQELEAQELQHGGKSLGYTRGDIGMGKAEAVQLRPTHAFTPKMEKRDLKAKWEHFMRESQSTYWKKRDILLRENYIKALEENFNPNEVKDIVQHIRDMDLDAFKKQLSSDPANFESAYPPDEEQTKAYLSELRAAWMPESKPKQYKAKKPTEKKKYKVKKTKPKKRAGKR